MASNDGALGDVRAAWRDISCGGLDYPLGHLSCRTREITFTGQGANPSRLVTLMATFGSHCFSRTPSSDESSVLEPDARVIVGREQRVFCVERHRLSLRLPAIVDDIEHRWCFHNVGGQGRPNFVIVEIGAGLPVDAAYFVFFRCWKDRQVLRLHVESAHARRDPWHRHHKRISFAVIAARTMAGGTLRPPP